VTSGEEIKDLAPTPVSEPIPLEAIPTTLSAEQLRNFVRLQAAECQALARWADALAEASPVTDKQQHMEPFLDLFAADAFACLDRTWEHAFKTAIHTTPEAQSALAYLHSRGPKCLDQDVDKAGPLLHLLDLSGDTEGFVRVDKQAISRHPHLALSLGDKLVGMQRQAEVIEVAETALKRTKSDAFLFSEHYRAREELLRFLCRTYAPDRDYQRLITCAQTLLFEENQLEDYLFLRDVLRTDKERQDLIRKVKARCGWSRRMSNPQGACEQLAHVYLDAYCSTTRPLDLTYLDYYGVMRYVTAFCGRCRMLYCKTWPFFACQS
jgi:hypothetical protein